MTKRVCLIVFFLCFHFFLQAEKKIYPFSPDPIDVVIVSHPKDKDTLDDCIHGIKENCHQVRRVIVVSDTKLTDNAEWFSEHQFPFSKKSIASVAAHGDKKRAQAFLKKKNHGGVGWYFQQLLKLYSPFVIPKISSNVLVVDADTIFLNPVSFQNESLGGLFCVSFAPGKQAYFEHAQRLVPGYERIYPEVYSVCHHMLFQKPILKDLFKTVKKHHHLPFWKAFCRIIDIEGRRGASEYEIYYNYALRHTDQVQIRGLTWSNSAYLSDRPFYQRDGYHFVSFHTYMRGKWPSIYGNTQ